MQILQLFVDSIKERILDKDDYSVIPLSTADDRNKCFYEYDLDIPKELKALETIIGNDQLDSFDFNDDSLSDICALIIVIADNNHAISLYKKLSPVEVIGRGSYMLWKANQRFERFNNQLLRISGNFQLIRVESKIVILDLNLIEKSFGFHDVIKREAIIGLNVIREKGIVSNINVLEDLIDNPVVEEPTESEEAAEAAEEAAKAAEEAAEMSAAFIRFLLEPKGHDPLANRDSALSELVDVMIMSEQVELVFGGMRDSQGRTLVQIRDEKLERLRGLVEV